MNATGLTDGRMPHHVRGMPTDEPQKPEPAEEIENELPEDDEVVEETETSEIEEVPPARGAASRFQSVRNLWIAIAVLTFLLIVSMIFNRPAASKAIDPDDPEIAAIKADMETRRAELNRQRAELNLPPLSGHGEDVAEITSRLRRDAETLVSLVERYQRLLADRDRELGEKNVELIRSVQIRDSLTAELGRASANTAGASNLQGELSEALARASRLADELADARRQIAALETQSQDEEIDLLTRRINEVTRTRDFYKDQVAELEARLRDNAGEE